jgi:hypothetical protein
MYDINDRKDVVSDRIALGTDHVAVSAKDPNSNAKNDYVAPAVVVVPGHAANDQAGVAVGRDSNGVPVNADGQPVAGQRPSQADLNERARLRTKEIADNQKRTTPDSLSDNSVRGRDAALRDQRDQGV